MARVDIYLFSLNCLQDESRIPPLLNQRNPSQIKMLEWSRRVPRDAIPPTPPGPEGSNGNGLVRVQRGARLEHFCQPAPRHVRSYHAPSSLQPTLDGFVSLA